jgi:hypothetical protein
VTRDYKGMSTATLALVTILAAPAPDLGEGEVDRSRTMTRRLMGNAGAFTIVGNAFVALQFAMRFSAIHREAHGAEGFDTVGEELMGIMAMSGSLAAHTTALGLAAGAGHHWARATGHGVPRVKSRRFIAAGTTTMIAGLALFAAGNAMQFGFCPYHEGDDGAAADTSCQYRWATGALFATVAGSGAMTMGAGMLGYGVSSRRVSLSLSPSRTGTMVGVGMAF